MMICQVCGIEYKYVVREIEPLIEAWVCSSKCLTDISRRFYGLDKGNTRATRKYTVKRATEHPKTESRTMRLHGSRSTGDIKFYYDGESWFLQSMSPILKPIIGTVKKVEDIEDVFNRTDIKAEWL